MAESMFEQNQQELLNRISNRIRQSLELQEILDPTVNEVRSFLGTDRVKVYQFQPDDHGVVIAESLAPDRLPSLLGLHFPADDIPPYARELYLQTRQRTIVDLANERIGLSSLASPDSQSAESVQEIQYRSVDPCHLEYLRSMGVQSSVVVPIVIAGVPKTQHLIPSLKPNKHLWGLLVSHHSEPRIIEESELSFIQAVVDQMAIAITHSGLLQHVREQAQQKDDINQIMGLLHTSTPMNLQLALEKTVTLFQGSGGRIYLPKQPSTKTSSITLETLSENYACAELYTCGDQPQSLSSTDQRCIEENALWQKYLTSVVTPQTKDADHIDTDEDAQGVAVDSDTVDSDTIDSDTVDNARSDKSYSSVPHEWSVPWMRSAYALVKPPYSAAHQLHVWATSDIYQEPLFRSLISAFSSTNIRGVLIMPLYLGHEVIGCLTVFREPVEQELVWAGEFEPDHRQLTPRQSFAAWRQILQSQVQQWTDAEMRLGQAIAERFSNAIKQYRLYEEITVLNTKLEQDVFARTQELEVETYMGKQQQAIVTILGKLQTASDTASIFRTATQEVRQLLNVERVGIYQFNEVWGGKFIHEFGCVSPELALSNLSTIPEWNDSYLQEHQGGCFRKRDLVVVNDVYAANLSDCHLEVLESYGIRSFVVMPLFVGIHLWGLLGVYQHSSTRPWKDVETKFVKQVAAHLGSALQQAELLTTAQKKVKQLPSMIDQQQAIAGVVAKMRESLDLTKI
ncbi:MAG: GAF domain-containing protein [Cyanobacteria bacterium P01_E01_bin.6]